MTFLCKATLLLPGFMAAAFASRPLPQPTKEPPRRILSLRLQRDHVFAATGDGLYRARLDKKQWQQLKGKTVPEPGGLFVTDLPEEKSLLYFVTPEARRKARDFEKIKNPERPGLYRSVDLGDTWQLLNNSHHFQQ